MNLLTISDFNNKVILNSSNTEEFETFASEAIDKHLLDLCGDYLFSLLIADLDSELKQPQTQIYIDFVNGVNYTDTNGKFTVYKGIKPMLINFVCYEWFEYLRTQNTVIGVVNPQVDNNELGNLQNFNWTIARNYWNKGIVDYRLAIKYLNDMYLKGVSYFADQYVFWFPKFKNCINKVEMVTLAPICNGHIERD